MIRTKQQADLHVADTLKRIRTKQERLLRGYQFAKLYVSVKEYDKAKEFLQGFLSVKDNSAPGHKLLGEILEAQHHLNEAAAAYTKSLNIDQLQKDVLLKICDLYSQINISPELAKVWADKGEKSFPTNDAIFKLKVKAHVGNGNASNNPEDMLGFLVAETTKCPSDSLRRVKLLRSYMDLDRINEAYTHILETEAKGLHCDSLEWYRCVIDVFKKYRETSGLTVNGKFHQMLLFALNRLAALSIEQSLTVAESVNAVWALDQELVKQGPGIANAAEEMKELYRELEAQYLFHCGTVILNKAQKERLSWREASEVAYACFLVSHSVTTIDRRTPWYAKASDESRLFYDRWYNDSCWRCSQTGHMLMQKYQSSDGGQAWIERIQDEYCHQLGRDKAFHILYTQPQQKDGQKQSYLTQCSLFSNRLVVPDKSLLMEWDNVVYHNNPENLQLAVWTCLHYYSVSDKTQPKYPFTMFERLPYGAKNLDTAAPESLCQLDVLAFLYATVRCAALKHHDRCGRYDPYRPNMLPLPICEKLCTETQREWWVSAYKLHTNNARDSLVRMRTVLQRGLETIRILGTNLGMDAGLVVHLAQTFVEQLEESKSQFDSILEVNDNNEHSSYLQARALHYWNKANELLEKLEKKRSVSMQRNPMFEGSDVSLSPRHVSVYLDEGRLFQAMEAKNAGRHSQAIRLFGQIKSAEAAFQSALLHKELAVLGQSSFHNESSSHNHGRELLLRSKNDLYETLDRIKGDRYHILNERVAEEIDDVETRLMRLGGLHGNTFDDEDEFPCNNFTGSEKSERSIYGSRKGPPLTHSTPQVQRSLISEADYSRSETRLRPSPDRLDAQLRSLSHGQDQWLKIIMDEMKDNRSTIQKLQERVTLLESKLQDTADQLKQHQAVAAAAAVAAQPTLAPPAAAMATQQPPTAIMYQPSPFRGEGYEYWGSHVYDPAAAIHGGLYRGYQQTLPAAYGVTYAGMGQRGVHLASHFAPSSSKLDTDDYAPHEGCTFGQDHEFDHSPGQEAVKGAQATTGSTGVGSVSALQPGYFSVPKLVGSENEIPSTGIRQDYVAHRPNEEQSIEVIGKSDGENSQALTSDLVLTIPNKPRVFKVVVSSSSSAERVLPAPSIIAGKPTGNFPAVAQPLNHSSESHGEEGYPEDEHTEPHFEPIVTLPEVVDLKTGEEDETVLFSEVVKLFRFADKNWKERGIGLLKILYNEKTRRARILMRREHVHVVCANHNIKPDMAIARKTPGEDKVLTWSAVDCSDGEPQLQQFCCKFKSEDVSSQFAENIDRAKKLIAGAETDGQAKAPQTSVPQITPTDSAPPVSSQLLKMSGFSFTPSPVSKAISDQQAKPSLPLFGSVTSASALPPGKPMFSAALQPSSVGSGFGGFSFSSGAKFGESAFPNSSVSFASSSSSTSSSSGAFTFSSLVPAASVSQADGAGVPAPVLSSFMAAKSNASAVPTPVFGSAFSASKLAPGAKASLFPPLSTSSAQSLTNIISFANKSTAEASAVIFAPSKFSTSGPNSDSVLSTPSSTVNTSGLNFGGFTFSKPPVFAATEKTNKEEKKEASKPPNPFASFSFVKPNSESAKPENAKPSGTQGSGEAFPSGFTWPVSGEGTLAQILKGDKGDQAGLQVRSESSTPSNKPSEAATKVFGESSAITELSFENVLPSGSNASSAGTFQSKKVDNIFKNKGQRLFESTKNLEVEAEDGNDDTADEYVPDKSFEALVSLPEVEVMTGEENEKKLFGERAKLYRMDNDSKQWKERGIGEIKILQRNFDNKFRILMRREQVLKVCANHSITSKMSLLPMKVSENAWCWFAKDFSEQELREEQLAVKFKTAEQAENFKRCFEDCQQRLLKATESSEVAGSSVSMPEKERAVLTDGEGVVRDNSKGVESSSCSLATMFKPKEGEWNCNACYVKNDGGKTKCIACDTPKPGAKIEPVSLQGQIVDNIGSSSSLASLFKPKEGEWQCDACYVKNDAGKTKCAACETPKPGAKIEPVSLQGKIIDNIGSSSSLASLFKPKEGEWQCDACYVKNDGGKTKCVACETPKPGVQGAAQPLDASASLQTKLGPSGGFVFNSGQVVSFGKGFGSTALDSGKEGQSADVKPVGFGQVSSGFAGFTFGNTKPADNSSGQPVKTTGKGEPVDGDNTDGSKPIFGGFAASDAATAAASKPFSGSVPSAFSFGGKGFSLGTFGGKAAESPKPGDATIKSDVANPAFGSSTSAPPSGSGVPPSSSSSSTADTPVITSTSSGLSSSLSGHKAFGSTVFSFAGVTPKEPPPAPLAPSGFATPSKAGSAAAAAAAAAASPASPQSPDGGFYKNTDGEDDHIVFEPIVKLPDNVEVKTGEEDEEVLYSQRAKLYRYCGKEWKERGIGDVKILRHKNNGQVRLLMRREKVLKICMNHRLTPEISLKPMPNTEGKAWTWHATDYSDGETAHENFSIRFKDSQTASEFQAAFNKALERVQALRPSGPSMSATLQQTGNELLLDLLKKPASSSQGVSESDSECELVSVKTPSQQWMEKAVQLQLPTYFYNYLDSPGCTGCCGCDPDSFDFSEIGKRVPEAAPRASVDPSVLASPHPKFGSAGKEVDAFKTPAANSISKPAEGSAPATAVSSAASAPSFALGSSSFVFGSIALGSHTGFGSNASQPSAAQKQESHQEQSSSQQSSIFGSVGQGVDFASLASETTTTVTSFPDSSSNPDFKWDGTGSTLFGSTKMKANREKNEDEDDERGGEGHAQEDEDHAQEDEDSCRITFTPVVQLPEVEVKTGEEEEREVFRERGKLYRFDNGQWKERGTGDMKILKHQVNGTFRLLLRREQVHKVACNHLLTVEMKLQAMSTSENAWCWFAQDFSDGEAKMEKFALKFKAKDVSDKFRERFEECQRELSQPGQSTIVEDIRTFEVTSGNSCSESHPVTSKPAPTSAAVAAGIQETASTQSQDDEEDDEEQSPPIFSKRAHLTYQTTDGVQHDGGLGYIVVTEDDDVYGYRLRMETDNSVVICNHIICDSYEIKRLAQRNTCEWTALDFSSNDPLKKTFQAQFSSEPALSEFEKVFKDGVEMAIRSELSESKNEEYNPYQDEDDDDDDLE